MSEEKSTEDSVQQELPEKLGVLLGWTADDLQDRIVLRMQCARSRPRRANQVEEFKYFLNKQQAALLGNFLMRMSGETAPRPAPKSWFKWLGKPRV